MLPHGLHNIHFCREYQAPAVFHYPTAPRRKHKHRKRSGKQIPLEDRPHTIDVIGNGRETTICGHIDLLQLLPIHHDMHRELLKTFKRKPGNYEGKFNEAKERKASVVNYGQGYLAIHFTDDITRPEMSEFLISKGWNLINAHCTTQHGADLIYEKWTNVTEAPQPRSTLSTAIPRYF